MNLFNQAEEEDEMLSTPDSPMSAIAMGDLEAISEQEEDDDQLQMKITDVPDSCSVGYHGNPTTFLLTSFVSFFVMSWHRRTSSPGAYHITPGDRGTNPHYQHWPQ